MWFFYLLSCISTILQICFLTISIAAGLYYLADLIEEYAGTAAKVIRYIILVVLGVHLGLFLFEELPTLLLLCGFVKHCLYYRLLKTFPVVSVASPVFIGGVVLLIFNHILAFSYFSSVFHPFSEVLAFFTICTWLVPFLLFVSLSANELVLPSVAEHSTDHMMGGSQSDVVSDYFRSRGKKYGLLSFFQFAQDSILPQKIKKKF